MREVQKRVRNLTGNFNQLSLAFNKYNSIKDKKNELELELQTLKAQHMK